MSLIRKIAVNNMILITERLLTAAAGFFVSVWLIRHFGSEKFGIYSLVFAWFTFLNVFTPPMIEQVVAREAVRFPDQMRKYLGAGLAIKLGLALLGWIAGMVAAWLLGYERQTLVYLAVVLLGLLGNACYVLQVPHSIELKLMKPALADGASNLFYQAGRAVMVALKFGLMPFFWLYLVFRMLQLVFFFLLGLEKKEYRPDWRFSYREVEEIFRASWTLLAINVFVMIISRIDQLLIWPIWGARAVGLYGSCANLTDYIVVIPAVWYTTVFPLITKFLGESNENFAKANHYSFKYLAVTSGLIFLGLAGFSREVLVRLFGPDYAEAAGALFWLSGFIVLSFIQIGLFSAALSRNLEKPWLLVNGAGAFANVALNLALIPRYGIAGAGFATFAAFVVQIFLTGALSLFRPDFKTMLSATARPIALAIAGVAAARYFDLKLFIWLPVLTIIYTAMLFITGSQMKSFRSK
jgi:O-antigen/teichoic acid export membrane protein